ncbi:hypothetical protein LNM68_25975, partial [Klebsiella pneumoniae]|nr:hypothetical protein [Klebsiella pneumoniae]
EWVHVQLHQQKGMISLSPPTICNSAQTKLLSILWGKVANLTLFWGGVVIFLYFIKWMLVA